MKISYQFTLEKAGAEVHCFKHFGSYQGDWWAKVTYQDKTFWVHGYYGSCSGCDAFEAEFGNSEPHCSDHEYCYDEKIYAECPECLKALAAEDEKKAAFGLEYLDTFGMSQEEAERRAGENIEWDSDAHEMVDFIKANAI